jgi:hypothetical protein
MGAIITDPTRRTCLLVKRNVNNITDDFWSDYYAMRAAGITFIREPKQAEYGTVAVFADLYGN